MVPVPGDAAHAGADSVKAQCHDFMHKVIILGFKSSQNPLMPLRFSALWCRRQVLVAWLFTSSKAVREIHGSRPNGLGEVTSAGTRRQSPLTPAPKLRQAGKQKQPSEANGAE